MKEKKKREDKEDKEETSQVTQVRRSNKIKVLEAVIGTQCKRHHFLSPAYHGCWLALSRRRYFIINVRPVIELDMDPEITKKFMPKFKE